MTMRAGVLRAAGDLVVREIPVPTPGAGEVLVRVGACGVCGSDATEFDRGPVLTEMPVTLGHEFAGVVEAVGESTTIPVGATVIAGAGISCLHCKPCRVGRTNLCREYRTAGLQVDGGLAGYVVVPEPTLLDVSECGLPIDTLALAQPMAIAVHAVRRSGLAAGQDAVIVGIGGIGTFLTVAAAAVGARLLVVDLDSERLDLALRLGAQEVLRVGDESLADRIDALGMDVDVFYEVSGSLSGLASVLGAARPGSTIVPVGIQKSEVRVPLGAWTLREYTIVGVVAHVIADDLPDAVRLLAARPDWSDLAGEVFPLKRVVDDALRPLVEGRSTQIKTLIDPWIDLPRRAVHDRNPV